MPLSKSFRRLATMLCSVGLIGGAVRADDSPVGPDVLTACRLDVTVRNGEIVGREQVRRAFITSGTNEFVFVVPQDFRVTTAADKITVVAADASYFLTVRFTRTPGGESPPTSVDFYRRSVLDQYPNATILEEFSKSAGGGGGPAFSLRNKATGKVERALRMAFIPTSGGVMEFSLNADLPKSREAEGVFNTLLRTFRSNERGKLKIEIRTSDQS